MKKFAIFKMFLSIYVCIYMYVCMCVHMYVCMCWSDVAKGGDRDMCHPRGNR